MTHPFHPLFGREFELVLDRRNWGEDRVYFHDEDGALCSLPAKWTDVEPDDPLVVVAAGRCALSIDGLLGVADLIERGPTLSLQVAGD